MSAMRSSFTTAFGVSLTTPLVYQVMPGYFESLWLPRAWLPTAMTVSQWPAGTRGPNGPAVDVPATGLPRNPCRGDRRMVCSIPEPGGAPAALDSDRGGNAARCRDRLLHRGRPGLPGQPVSLAAACNRPGTLPGHDSGPGLAAGQRDRRRARPGATR